MCFFFAPLVHDESGEKWYEKGVNESRKYICWLTQKNSPKGTELDHKSKFNCINNINYRKLTSSIIPKYGIVCRKKVIKAKLRAITKLN